MQVLDLKYLEQDNAKNNHPKVWIELAKNSFKDIHFVLANLSAIQVVEKLQKDKCAVYICEKPQFALSLPVGIAICMDLLSLIIGIVSADYNGITICSSWSRFTRFGCVEIEAI